MVLLVKTLATDIYQNYVTLRIKKDSTRTWHIAYRNTLRMTNVNYTWRTGE